MGIILRNAIKRLFFCPLPLCGRVRVGAFECRKALTLTLSQRERGRLFTPSENVRLVTRRSIYLLLPVVSFCPQIAQIFTD